MTFILIHGRKFGACIAGLNGVWPYENNKKVVSATQ